MNFFSREINISTTLYAIQIEYIKLGGVSKAFLEINVNKPGEHSDLKPRAETLHRWNCLSAEFCDQFIFKRKYYPGKRWNDLCMHFSEYLGKIVGVFIFYSEGWYAYCINYPAITGHQMMSELVEGIQISTQLQKKLFSSPSVIKHANQSTAWLEWFYDKWPRAYQP